tara:strand:- start:57 stop:302 length:246 start_codon:yes stop_codon:yes gene_type:complete
MNKETQIVRNTLMYIWNTEWNEFCQMIFDINYIEAEDHKKEYLHKYMLAYSQNPAQLFAILDYDNMNKITIAAKEKYGEIK